MTWHAGRENLKIDAFEQIGRERELQWLYERFATRRGPVVISGPPGIGKTTLIQHFLHKVQLRTAPIIIDAKYGRTETMIDVSAKIEEIYKSYNRPDVVVVENADVLTEEDIDSISSWILNFKIIKMLAFLTRSNPQIRRAEILILGSLMPSESEKMLIQFLGSKFPPEVLKQAVRAASGSPLILKVLVELASGRNSENFERLLRGDLYDLNQQFVIPENKLIVDAKPKIILTNQTLIEQLRKKPNAIHELSPREFEELTAELLDGLGYEVELTPASRDGGKDILAYMATPHGKLLCLVEAKRYRRDRTVGVELVRQLYGTLADADASSAMLVTTSSFSADAKEFQKRHQYKLALRDFTSIVKWIDEHKSD